MCMHIHVGIYFKLMNSFIISPFCYLMLFNNVVVAVYTVAFIYLRNIDV